MVWLNKLIALILPLFPRSLVKLFAKQYIAGETLEQALVKTTQLNREGIGVTLDLLGEDPGDKSDCTRALGVYEKAKIGRAHV